MAKLNQDRAVFLNQKLGDYEDYLVKNVKDYVPHLYLPQPWMPHYAIAEKLSDELSEILANDAYKNI